MKGLSLDDVQKLLKSLNDEKLAKLVKKLNNSGQSLDQYIETLILRDMEAPNRDVKH